MGAARERRRRPCMAAAAAASAHGDGATTAHGGTTKAAAIWTRLPRAVAVWLNARWTRLWWGERRGKMEVAVVEWDRGYDGGKEQRRSVPVLRNLWL
ncbi:monofunctional biosynthetic peptidoglycan transglycosylase [Sesbania bispinosa]|nr:monofunctional biosynthetic peptidoglycan transglycosylase [Sesbania bispinosa]